MLGNYGCLEMFREVFFPMWSSAWWWICLATFPHVVFSSLCLTWTIHISYPLGNKSISHQTGRVTSSSSQKYCLGGDMIDPRRVYIVCAKIQAPPLFRHNSLIAHQRIPVMAGGMMMIPNVRSWSTLAHIYSIDPDDWTRGSEQMLHMWRVPAPCSWIFQRTPRKDPTPQLGLAGFVGFFPRYEVRGACSTGDLYKKWGMSPVALLIFVAPCRRFQHLVGEHFPWGKLENYMFFSPWLGANMPFKNEGRLGYMRSCL